MTELRELEEVLRAQPASDGDGVKLKRVFGGPQPERFDPFLMLDEFGSESAADYIGGFPAHPHRGFETVTYMLNGYMEHRDHMGNVGKLGPGDVQWMRAGSGIIHSEMPQQEEGLMRGFQLWVNLPASEKMEPASYADIAAADIPEYALNGLRIKAVAGSLSAEEHTFSGACTGISTEPGFLDLFFENQREFTIDIPDGHTLLVYVYEGRATVGESNYELKPGHLARMSQQGALKLQATAETRLLILSGKPINEPIVQHGPFVMNSVEEIQQAIRAYSEGTLV